MSFAESPKGSSPVNVTRIVFGSDCGKVCVASTCSTSDVPMPNASAPNAPCVEVWLSPQTIVRPGCARPSSGPITCTIPSRPLPVAKSRTPNPSQLRRSAPRCARASAPVIGPPSGGPGWRAVYRVAPRRVRQRAGGELHEVHVVARQRPERAEERARLVVGDDRDRGAPPLAAGDLRVRGDRDEAGERAGTVADVVG